MAQIARIEGEPENRILWFQFPPELAPFLVPKGSVALDGVSLTIVEMTEQQFSVALVPYTWWNTTFRYRRVGDWVNIEVDVVSRYLKRFAEVEESVKASKITESWMKSLGY